MLLGKARLPDQSKAKFCAQDDMYFLNSVVLRVDILFIWYFLIRYLASLLTPVPQTLSLSCAPVSFWIFFFFFFRGSFGRLGFFVPLMLTRTCWNPRKVPQVSGQAKKSSPNRNEFSSFGPKKPTWRGAPREALKTWRTLGSQGLWPGRLLVPTCRRSWVKRLQLNMGV